MKQFITDEEITSADGKWQRSGGCTVGCGKCCEFMVLPIRDREPPYASLVRQATGYIVWLDLRINNLPTERFNDLSRWADYHGVKIILPDLACYIPTHDISIYESGDWLACRINLQCEKLERDGDGDGRCGVNRFDHVVER